MTQEEWAWYTGTQNTRTSPAGGGVSLEGLVQTKHGRQNTKEIARIRFRIQGVPNPIFSNSGVFAEQDLPIHFGDPNHIHLGDLYHIHLLNSKEESVDTQQVSGWPPPQGRNSAKHQLERSRCRGWLNLSDGRWYLGPGWSFGKEYCWYCRNIVLDGDLVNFVEYLNCGWVIRSIGRRKQQQGKTSQIPQPFLWTFMLVGEPD